MSEQKRKTIEQRLLEKCIKPVDSDSCWQWIGARQPTGYGQLWNGTRPEQAHRISYRIYVGQIPENMEIDHKCRNPSCINPAHLEPVLHKENIYRSNTIMGINARKTSCKRGHPLEGHNLVISSVGTRQCRTCINMHARNAKRKRREARTYE